MTLTVDVGRLKSAVTSAETERERERENVCVCNERREQEMEERDSFLLPFFPVDQPS